MDDSFYHLQVILASGYYAVFRVKLIAKELEGIHDGAVQITTDYEVYLLYIHWCYLSDRFNFYEFLRVVLVDRFQYQEESEFGRDPSGSRDLCKLTFHQTIVMVLVLCLL